MWEVDTKSNNRVCQLTPFLVNTKRVLVKLGMEAVFVSGTLVRPHKAVRCHRAKDICVEYYISLLQINQPGAQIFLICLLFFSTCFGQLCAHHQEKIPYLCDTWY